MKNIILIMKNIQSDWHFSVLPVLKSTKLNSNPRHVPKSKFIFLSFSNRFRSQFSYLYIHTVF